MTVLTPGGEATTPAEPRPAYAYYAYDLRTGVIHDELDLRGAQPRWAINDPGDLGSVTAPLKSIVGDRQDARRATIREVTTPWRYGVAVARNEAIIWAGVISSRRYSSDGTGYDLTVPGIMRYWDRQPLALNLTWTGVDQFQIVRDVLTDGGLPAVGTASTYPGVPLIMPPVMSGVLRAREIAGGDLKSALAQVLEIADNLNGFELVIDSAMTPSTIGTIQHTLRLGSPHIGASAADPTTLLGLEYPGNVLAYSWDEDGEEFGTSVWGVGQTDDGVAMVKARHNTSLLTAGFPRVGVVRQWDNISNPATLDAKVQQALAEATAYANTPTVTVPDSGDTAGGRWSVGDSVRVRITDRYRFPRPDNPGAAGVDTVLRIAEASLDPAGGKVTFTMMQKPEPV